MKVPVSKNPPPERADAPEDFPKTSVNLEYLLSRFPALYSDFALVSALSCLSAIKIARNPLPAPKKVIVKFKNLMWRKTIKPDSQSLT
jgi:hypothetical protein